jgi:hypothetical protein
MLYDQGRFEQAVEQFGEVFFVLDSDREYIVHGTEGYEFVQNGNAVRAEGMQDGEYVVGVFPLDAIEHHYAHKEV